MQELTLQTSLGAALMVTSGYAAPDVEQAYTRARELCQHLGERAQLIPVLLGLRAFYQVRGVLQTAQELGEQVVALAQQASDAAYLAHAYFSLGHTLYTMGKFGAAQERLEQGLALYDPQQRWRSWGEMVR
jgi:tetratricopeptide (TPR) repeat protein